MNSLEELTNRLEAIKEELPNLRSEVAQEQVIYNEKMDEIISELSGYEEEVFEIIKNGVINIMPSEINPAIDELYNKSEQLRQILKFLGKDEDFVERFGFDRTIYEIGHAVSVDRVNEVLKEFINDMDAIGIKLEYSNFNYSSFTLKYMEKFFENMNNENYLFIMKKSFDDIYWECPLLLTHIELCVRNLVANNKKIIVKHINHLLNKNLLEAHIKKEDIIDEYVKARSNYEDVYNCDAYSLIEYFKQNRKELDKYITNSIQFDQLIGSITDSSYYMDLDTNDKALFLNNVNSLLYDVREYEYIEKFKKIFDFAIGIFNNKDSLKGLYKAKLKEIAKLEKEKNGLDRKVNALKTKKYRLNESDITRINAVDEQLKVVYNDLAKKIEAIKTAVDEAYDLRFQETFANTFNSSSSLYEVVVFLSRYYAILYREIGSNKKMDKEMIPSLVDEFRHIQYSSHLTIMKSTPFLDYANVKELIQNKYKLFNIRCNIPDITSGDFTTLVDNLTAISRYNDLLRIKLSPEDISVMLKVIDILNKE